MPQSPGTPACEAVSGLLPAAALDVLSPAERLEVQSHVARCQRCAADLDELMGAAAVLGTTVPQVEPPPDLRGRVLSAALSERPALSAPAATPVPLVRRVPRNAPMWAAVAAALVVSGGSLAWAASLQSQMATLQQKATRYDRVVSVLASQSLAIKELQPAATNGARGYGTIYLDPESRSGMVMVHDLPALPADKAWQLWYVRRNGERLSGGMLRSDASGTGYTIIQVPDDLGEYESIGITAEPIAGSTSPTSPRVIGTQL